MDTYAVWAQQKPNSLAVVEDSGRQLTWAQLVSDRNRLVDGLLGKLKLQREDRVVIYAHNCLEYLVCNAAISIAGLLSIPMNWRLNEEEVIYICNNSESQAVFFEPSFLPMIEKIRSKVGTVKHWVLLDASSSYPSSSSIPKPCTWLRWYSQLLAECEDKIPKVDTLGGGMLYTGGTTGKPKGALRRKARDPETTRRFLDALDLRPPQIHLIAGPIYHSAPSFFAGCTLLFGGTAIILRKFNPESSLALIEKFKITSSFMAPTLLKMITTLPEEKIRRYDTSSLRVLIVAAAPCPVALKEQIFKLLGPVLYEFYGSTELGLNTVLRPEDQLRKPGSCGKAFAEIDIKLMDKNGNEVPVGQEGILYVRKNDNVIDEYWQAEEKTRELFLGEWMTVGDIARKDEEGFYFICDRAIDMVISGGVNIYPAEIEDVFHRHPAIADIAVFGVPDETWGERVHAAIVLKEGHSVTVEEFKQFCKKHIADYKCPREFSFHNREDFPRDAAGKIRKRLLREPHWKKLQSRL